MANLEIGDPAPDFALAAEDGGTIRLGDFAGRHLVLYFYPKDDTSGCTKEAQAFSDALDRFAAAGAAILGVSKDSAASHARFRAKYGLRIALGADPEGSAVEAYGCWVEKSMYGRKYFGIERATFLVAPDGRISAIWRKVKVPGHADAVLKALKG